MKQRLLAPAAAAASLAASIGLLFARRMPLGALAALFFLMILWRIGSCFLAAATAHLLVDLFSKSARAAPAVDSFKRIVAVELSWAILLPASLIARWADPLSIAAGIFLLFAFWLLNAALRVQALARQRAVSPVSAGLAIFGPYLGASAASFALVMGAIAAAAFQFKTLMSL